MGCGTQQDDSTCGTNKRDDGRNEFGEALGLLHRDRENYFEDGCEEEQYPGHLNSPTFFDYFFLYTGTGIAPSWRGSSDAYTLAGSGQIRSTNG